MQGNVTSSSHRHLRFLGQKSDRGGTAIAVVLQGMLKLTISARSGDGGGRDRSLGQPRRWKEAAKLGVSHRGETRSRVRRRP
ncbi:hypothetical protein ACS0PU_010205 [Formica fusca]